jgi:acyl-CoA reductase-like NAD-dependent aldehyde dehydrogenase
VVQLVNGRGLTTGAALARDPRVGCISFTGGPHAGASIATAAAARFAKVTMELGGKSANIVLADAPYEDALEGAVSAAFGNSGQACLAGSRILVEAPIADRFIADLVRKTEALRIGHTFDEDAEIGPQSSRAQMERVLSYADIARAEGAEILCGGRRPAGFEGFHVEPTIARVARNGLRVCQEEIFGPLVTVQVVADARKRWRWRTTPSLGLRDMCGARTPAARNRWPRVCGPAQFSSTRRWCASGAPLWRLRRERRRSRRRPLEPRFLQRGQDGRDAQRCRRA